MPFQLIAYIVGVIFLFLAGFEIGHPRINAFALGWAFIALGFFLLG